MAAGKRVNDLDLGPVGKWVEDESLRESKFLAEWLNRLVTGRDMHVIVTAASETGVGKTTLAVSLALLLDQHGWTADKAAVADARRYNALYDAAEPGEVLLLDEAEKAADSRRGMATESVELSQAFAARRYQQVFGILTAPTKSWVDRRLGADSADYWIQAQQTDKGRVKGEAKVYRLKNNEHYESSYVEKTEYIHWPVLDWHDEFRALERRKDEILSGDDGAGAYIHREELEGIKADVRDQAEKEARDEIIERMSEEEFTHAEIAAAVGLSRSRVSQILG